MDKFYNLHKYTRIKQLVTQMGSHEIKVLTKPGLPNWDVITPSTHLLAEKIILPAHAKVLFLGCGHGAASASLSRQLSAGTIWLTDINYIALQMAKETLAANQVNNGIIISEPVSLLKNINGLGFVIIDLPKGRKLLRRWLCEAHSLLAAGGKLYLAGANQQGVQSAIKDAKQLFGNSTTLEYKKGNRLALSVKSAGTPGSAPWSKEEGIAPGTWRQIQIKMPQSTLELYSLPGVFSFDRLDEGTRLLLSNMEISVHDRVLDLGCGVGVLGIAAAQAGAAQVDCVDANLFAIAATRKNLAKYNLTHGSAQPSDVLSALPDRRFDKIFTNPPFHSGAPVDYQVAQAFIRQSLRALSPGGCFSLVANKFIRYDRLMKEIFPTVEMVAENARYQVWRAIAPV